MAGQLTLDKVFDLMDSQQLYWWRLDMVANGARRPIGKFRDLEEQAGTAEGAEARKKAKATPINGDESKKQLDHLVSFFSTSPGTVFEITLKTDSRNSDAAQAGPFQFIDQRAINVVAQQNQPQQPAFNPGMYGLGDLTPRSVMEERLAIERERTQLMVDKAQFEAEKKRFEEEKKTTLEGLKDKEKNFDNHSNKVSAGIIKGITHLIEKAVPEKDGVPLSGAEVTTEAETTPEEKICEEVAGYMYENLKSIKQLEFVKEKVTLLVDTLSGKSKEEKAA